MVSGPDYGVDAVVMKVRPDSMIPLLRSGRPALGGDRDAPGWNVPSAHFDDRAASEGIPSGDDRAVSEGTPSGGEGIPSGDDRRRCPQRGETRGQGKRFTGPQRDVVVTP